MNKKRAFVILVGLACLMGCLGKRDKSHYDFTSRMFQDSMHKDWAPLYVEAFNLFRQGGWGTDINSYYLTDSVNFRIYLGTYDQEDEYIYIYI